MSLCLSTLLILCLVFNQNCSSSLAFAGIFHRGGFLSSRGASTHSELLNSTIGHSDAILSLGLNAPVPLGTSKGDDAPGSDAGEDDYQYEVPSTEMEAALDRARMYRLSDKQDLEREGWVCVSETCLFALYKRRCVASSGGGEEGKADGRAKSKANAGPTEYLMIGHVDDVSPRSFLHAQVDRDVRVRWDKTMASMEVLRKACAPTGGPGRPWTAATPGVDEYGRVWRMASNDRDDGRGKCLDTGIHQGHDRAEDTLYYRTKWPWPLKDRDYILARRCKHFNDETEDALVFVSRSTDAVKKPEVDGVLRVDKYWCHSTFFSSASEGRGRRCMTTLFQEGDGGGEDKDKDKRVPSTCIDSPGVCFITNFCDDQKVPLPTSVVDVISRVAEKQVPSSMMELLDVAKKMDGSKIVATGMSSFGIGEQACLQQRCQSNVGGVREGQ